MSTADKMLRARLGGYIKGAYLARAIACAAELGLADEIGDEFKSARQLAVKLNCCEEYLLRLMRVLCTVGIFAESEGGDFKNTAMSQLLRSMDVGSMKSVARFHGGEMIGALGGLFESVKSGLPAWDVAYGVSVWDYFCQQPDRASMFDAMMEDGHRGNDSDYLAVIDVAPGAIIVDVGGGSGSLIRELLLRNQKAFGVLFDLPHVLRRSEALNSWNGLRSRMEFVPGNVFAQVPRGGDIYLLRRVLHDWGDARVLQILDQCRLAMKVDSRLIVIEESDDPEANSVRAWSNFSMMIFGGQERTQKEYQTLVQRAGLEMTSCWRRNGLLVMQVVRTS